MTMRSFHETQNTRWFSFVQNCPNFYTKLVWKKIEPFTRQADMIPVHIELWKQEL